MTSLLISCSSYVGKFCMLDKVAYMLCIFHVEIQTQFSEFQSLLTLFCLFLVLQEPKAVFFFPQTFHFLFAQKL